MNIKTFTESLKPIYIYDHLVHMKNGKAYRVYRCGSDRAVYEYMRSQGFDTKEIVKVDLIPKKQGLTTGKSLVEFWKEKERKKMIDREKMIAEIQDSLVKLGAKPLSEKRLNEIIDEEIARFKN